MQRLKDTFSLSIETEQILLKMSASKGESICSLVGMNSIYLWLLVHASLATAIPVLDNGMGEKVSGPESVVTDFAVLAGNNLGTLPPDITICSSIATRAFLGFMAPFQLLYQDGTPWITVRTDLALKDQTRHKIIFYVSF